MPTLRYSDGKVSILSGADNPTVHATPSANLGIVLFHSELEYPTIISTHTGTTSFASLGVDQFRRQSYTLFAHGKSGTPWVEGRLVGFEGANVPLVGGGTPIWMDIYGFGRYLALGADATNVVLHEYIQTGHWTAAPDQTVNWTVYMTDVVL